MSGLNVNARYPRFSLVDRTAEDVGKNIWALRHPGQHQRDPGRHLPGPAPAHLQEAVSRDIGKERPCLNHHLGNCDGWCRPEMTGGAVPGADWPGWCSCWRAILGRWSRSSPERWRRPPRPCGLRPPPSTGTGSKAIQLLGKRQKVVASLRSDVDVCGLFLGMPRAVSWCSIFWPGTWRAETRRSLPPLWRRTRARCSPPC